MKKIITDPLTGIVMVLVLFTLALAGIKNEPIIIKPLPASVGWIVIAAFVCVILLDIKAWVKRHRNDN